MAESLQELSWMLSGLNAASRRVGLGMKLDKTKVMYNAHIKPEPVAVGEATIEVVQEYVYLGQTVRRLATSTRRLQGASNWVGLRSGNFVTYSPRPFLRA
ncbi:hypothetical protein JYU34_002791 [Plutella xylostella]|uniref:Reverse transcriptase n=1 Tax=Plutella xylostella TaxID=51655 RepID=A0ABQ7R362_PLUXY|nr:hypothetical protein JYU34_002791 [Plutella xylostella]